MPCELRSNGGGGCEDPRVTYVEPLKCYLMTYTACSPGGPHIAMAMSNDLLTWSRLGLASFHPYEGMKLSGIDNKDVSFPVNIPNPTSGTEQLNCSAGVMILSEEHLEVLLYRSPKPLLEPKPSTRHQSTPANVVFPTGIDRRDDLGQSDRFNLYYGMNDFRIGVARLDIPDVLPSTGIANAAHRL
jgi:predicted GH43/DUF377 family glycosyl hydrolase